MNNFFCPECIAAEPTAKFALWAVLFIAATCYALYCAYRNFKKARLIEDMPTSLIRSASQGFIELIGLAKVKGEYLTGPLTASPCLWWNYCIEQYKSTGKSRNWVTIESGTSEQAFYIDDATGLCIVMPKGADLTARHAIMWQGRQRHPLGSAFEKQSASTLGRLLTAGIGLGKKYRYTERLIKENDPLYILGHFTSDSSGQRTLSVEKMAGDILRSWKQDFASLLTSYDQNSDGEMDIAEWASVQKAAKREALKQQRSQSAGSIEHLIARPEEAALPFIIGSEEQDTLSRRYRYRAIGFSLAFLLAGSGASWYLGARFITNL